MNNPADRAGNQGSRILPYLQWKPNCQRIQKAGCRAKSAAAFLYMVLFEIWFCSSYMVMFEFVREWVYSCSSGVSTSDWVLCSAPGPVSSPCCRAGLPADHPGKRGKKRNEDRSGQRSQADIKIDRQYQFIIISLQFYAQITHFIAEKTSGVLLSVSVHNANLKS